MVIMFGMGVFSFALVGSLWIISSLRHRPILGGEYPEPGQEQAEPNNLLDEEQAAVTTATWTVLHPPS